MVEGDPTHELTASEGAPASPPAEAPVENHESPPPSEASAEGGVPEPAAEGPAHEPTTVKEAQDRPSLDWSHLRGFQTVEAPSDELAARADYPNELAKEISARATRFGRSVDESIVLSSDGLMRWLGDPVARIVSGDALLTPHAVLLADEALAGEDRAAVETRVSLWLAAHIRKLLGPLVSLAEGANLPDAAKALGARIAEALGVLERDPVRAEVKALDQSARGALRKLGVRFGSHYIYVPILLKPGARGFCTLLWTLRRGAETGADRLLAFASAGRTSFANEGLLSPDAYRVAGFRLCGERVVRVDIIERLSDLIRAAIPDHLRFGSRAISDAYGFLVTPQMTSLTGCSGEPFASILRSLGFEAVKVSKAAYEAANRKAPTEPIKPISTDVAEGGEAAAATPSDISASEDARAEHADAAPADEATESPQDASGADEVAEPSPSADNQAPVEIAAEAESVTESVMQAPGADEVAEPSPPADSQAAVEMAAEAESVTESVLQAHDAEAALVPAELPVETSLEAADAVEATSPPVEGAAELSDPAEPVAGTLDDSGEAPADAEAAASSVDEEIEIWRPAPRRPRAPPRPQGADRDARAHHGKKPRDHRRHERAPEAAKPAEIEPAREAVAAPSHPESSPRGGRPERRDEAPRWREQKGKEDGRARDDRRPGKDFGPRRETRAPQIDPDSPFAKLAALKPLLERRDKRP